MRKLLTAALIITGSLSLAMGQGINTPQSTEDIIRLAHAPGQPDGIGRAVVVVVDQNGAPVGNAYIKLASVWGGDNLCESWGSTNSAGVIALNPIHMGHLKLKIKAKGYQTETVEIPATSLNEPVRVTLHKK